MSDSTPDTAHLSKLRVRDFHTLWSLFPQRSTHSLRLNAVLTPRCTHHGLGSPDFARRYFRDRFFFLFLRLLRCFSSPGSLLHAMYSRSGTGGLLQWVSPFRDRWITSYLPIPIAYRSLSRLSSALSAWASTLCSYCLTNLHFHATGSSVGRRWLFVIIR